MSYSTFVMWSQYSTLYS